MLGDCPRLVELTAIPDFWVDGIGKVEALGCGSFRFYLYRKRRPLEGHGPIDHEVVATIIANIEGAAIVFLTAAGEIAQGATVGMLAS